MKFLLVVVLSTAVPLAQAASHGSSRRGAEVDEVNPIEKVLSMLSELQTKMIKEGEGAQKVYEEFTEWCEERSRNVGFEIKDGKKETGSQQAVIDSSIASINQHNAKVQELAAAISQNEADLSQATEIRRTESETFKTQEKELIATVSTLERGIMILEKEMKKGGASFSQLAKAGNNYIQAISVMVDASMVGTQDAAKLTALVQAANTESSLEEDMVGSPKAAAYEGQSGGIIDTLNDLLDKAKVSLDSARTEDSNRKNNFELTKTSLVDEIKYSKKDMAEQKKKLAATAEAKSTADGDFAVASKALKAATATLAGLHSNCMKKAQDFQTSTKSRGEELKAIATAEKVIKESTGGATAQSYKAAGLNQEGDDSTADDDTIDLSDLAFVQVAQQDNLNIRSGTDLANFEAVRLVRDLARRTRSRSLQRLAQRMANVIRHTHAGSKDPFKKVRSLIKNMIDSLLKEAQSAASHKAYCDKETAESKQKQADKTATKDKLKAKIDGMMSKSAMLKDQVSTLLKELAALASAQTEMNNIRTKEKATFVKSKKEMEEGITGIKTALKVLRDYYGKKSDHDSADGAGGGIVGMLEVVESDFTKGLSEMVVAEQTGASSYRKETESNEIEKARKNSDVKYKKKETKSLDVAVSQSKSDKALNQQELDAITAYLGKINEMCVVKPESYADKKARRDAEIEGLNQALSILNGGMFLQRETKLRGTKLHLK